ncbi:hypothetical protein VNO78_09490 [Psophocarpus tetragonolobus]|uniref:Uncharacterized protein n=1 Tax=Psophocarpus tetragonolobus TaxID=3891 RepID=A0AAN9SXJ9_PSOTE
MARLEAGLSLLDECEVLVHQVNENHIPSLKAQVKKMEPSLVLSHLENPTLEAANQPSSASHSTMSFDHNQWDLIGSPGITLAPNSIMHGTPYQEQNDEAIDDPMKIWEAAKQTGVVGLDKDEIYIGEITYTEDMDRVDMARRRNCFSF